VYQGFHFGGCFEKTTKQKPIFFITKVHKLVMLLEFNLQPSSPSLSSIMEVVKLPLNVSYVSQLEFSAFNIVNRL